jgi:hypothetical protein
MEDFAFILGHESAHKYINLLLASEFELNYHYSILIQRGWDQNFLEDMLINQSFFHTIPSNLVERYYANTSNWSQLFLQRLLPPFNKLKQLTEIQQTKLDLYKQACQAWYKDDEIPLLFEVFKSACKFLALFPPEDQSELLVKHEKDEEDEAQSAPVSIDPDIVSSKAGSGNQLAVKLRIPYVTDFKLSHTWRMEKVIASVAEFSNQLMLEAKKLQDSNGVNRIPGYSEPTDEELISWEVEQYIPWSEPVASPQSSKIVVIFDVSGSMFQYLMLLSSIRDLLANLDVTYYAFSNILSNIDFLPQHAEVQTGFGTSLTVILELLQTLEPSNVWIVSDGVWSLSREYPPDRAEGILSKHFVTLFQRGTSKIKHINPGTCMNVINI